MWDYIVTHSWLTLDSTREIYRKRDGSVARQWLDGLSRHIQITSLKISPDSVRRLSVEALVSARHPRHAHERTKLSLHLERGSVIDDKQAPAVKRISAIPLSPYMVSQKKKRGGGSSRKIARVANHGFMDGYSPASRAE